MSHLDDSPVPLGQPRVRWDDLSSPNKNNATGASNYNNYSRYDRTVAAPSDQGLFVMWTGLSVVLLANVLFIGVVLLSILVSRKARKNPYNIYLIFLMILDFWFAGLCLLTCALSAAAGHYYSPAMCRFQSWYLTTGLSGNAWLNAVVGHEIYRLLKSSHRRQRYFPPTTGQVICNSLLVYAGCAFLGTWSIVQFDWLPTAVDAQAGFVCMPFEYNAASTIFMWVVFVPLYFVIPYGYTLWIVYDVLYRSHMWPPKGRRRQLTVYFFRIIFVFAIMWAPCVFVFYVMRGIASPWVTWGAGLYTHMQGGVSAALSLMKPDVFKATMNLVTCRGLRRRLEGATTTTGGGLSNTNTNEEATDSNMRTSGFGFPGRSGSWRSVSLRMISLASRDTTPEHDDNDDDNCMDEGMPIQNEGDFQFQDEIIEDDDEERQEAEGLT